MDDVSISKLDQFRFIFFEKTITDVSSNNILFNK